MRPSFPCARAMYSAVLAAMVGGSACTHEPTGTETLDVPSTSTTSSTSPTSPASPASPASEWHAPGDALTLLEDGWIEARLRDTHPDIEPLLAAASRHRLQILVTEIQPVPGEAPRVRTHAFRPAAEYTYPASAIKTFASVVALRKLQRLQHAGALVDVDTPIARCPDDASPCEVTPDPDNLEGGVLTLRQAIREMQLVSDNGAFNDLYDFVGHEELNQDLAALGFDQVRVHHRMYDPPDSELRLRSPRIELRPADAPAVVFPVRTSGLDLGDNPGPGLAIGKAHLQDGARVEAPLDFRRKNDASVVDLHRLTLALVLGVPDLGLEPTHLELLRSAMSEDPLESSNPRYTDPQRSGMRYKTLLPGIARVLPPDRIEYLGKSGRAYGFHLDNAYIENLDNGCAVAVTATIYANANEVLNDDAYEYDEVTRPFLRDLGEAVARASLVDCRD